MPNRCVLGPSAGWLLLVCVGCGDGEATLRKTEPSAAGGTATGGTPAAESSAVTGGANSATSSRTASPAGGGAGGNAQTEAGGTQFVTSLAGANTGGTIAPSAGSSAGGANAYGGSSHVAGSGGGEAGVAGSTVDQCASHPNCDDHNPCTKDTCAAATGCTHEPVADGSPCNDGDICTQGDQCKQALCQGAARESKAELLSTLYSYGGFREDNGALRGASLVLDGNRIVFVDPIARGSVASLVQVTDEGRLVLKDQRVTGVRPRSETLDGWMWLPTPRYDLFPLSRDRFVLGTGLGMQYHAHLIDVENDTLLVRPRYQQASAYITALGFDGTQLWVLSYTGASQLLPQADGTITLEQEVSSLRGKAYQVVTSLTQEILYAATRFGIERWDMSTSPPTRLTTLWSDRTFVGLAVNAEYLVTQEATVDGGGTLSAVTVYRLSDLSQVAVFPGGMSQQPVSFALTEQGLLIEWDIFDGPYRRLVSKHYRLSGAEAEQLSQHVVWENCCDDTSRVLAPVRTSSHGSLAVLSPWQQVLRLEANGTRQRMLTGTGHGGLTQVAAVGNKLATAFDAYSSQLIDLSDPRSPRFLEGGLFEPKQSHPSQLYYSASDESLRLLPTSANKAGLGESLNNTVMLMKSSEGGRAFAADGVTLGDAAEYLFTSGGDVYQISATSNTAYRLRRYDYAQLSNSGTNTLQAEYEVKIEADSSVAAETFVAVADPYSRAIAVAETREGTETQLCVHWLEQQEQGVQWRGSLSVPIGSSSLVAVRVARGRIMTLSDDALRIFRLEGDRVVQESALTFPSKELSDTAGMPFFDGKRVALSDGVKLVVYDVDTWEVLGSYPLGTSAESVAEVDGNWLIGSDTALHVLSPECRVE